MPTLILFPWSPFCTTVRRFLGRHGILFRRRNIPFHKRASIIRATNGLGHTVPCSPTFSTVPI